MITPYEQSKTLCFGTALGFLIFWLRQAGGRFAELPNKRLGEGGETLDIMASKNHDWNTLRQH
jgi:hypothetical protein